MGRNPRTGAPLKIKASVRPKFVPGKVLVESLNQNMEHNTKIWSRMLKSGVVMLFNSDKGYGFIKQDESTRDVSFDISDVENVSRGLLKQGSKVKYLINSDGGKVRATNIILSEA